MKGRGGVVTISSTQVVKLLLRYGADITLQNDLGETALEVASDELRKLILS